MDVRGAEFPEDYSEKSGRVRGEPGEVGGT